MPETVAKRCHRPRPLTQHGRLFSLGSDVLLRSAAVKLERLCLSEAAQLGHVRYEPRGGNVEAGERRDSRLARLSLNGRK